MVPGNVASTSVRSLDVQEEAGGKVVVVCAKAGEDNRMASKKGRKGRLHNANQAPDWGKGVLDWVKGWFINNCLRLRNETLP